MALLLSFKHFQNPVSVLDVSATDIVQSRLPYVRISGHVQELCIESCAKFFFSKIALLSEKN